MSKEYPQEWLETPESNIEPEPVYYVNLETGELFPIAECIATTYRRTLDPLCGLASVFNPRHAFMMENVEAP